MFEGISRCISLKKSYQILKLCRNWGRAQSGDYSFAGEAAHLKILFETLGILKGYVVDIAASDGVSHSCTVQFFRDPNWAGLAIEMRPDKFAQMAYAYADFENVQLAKCRVTPGNVVALLQGHEVPPDFALLNLDIDSYDLFVLEQILVAGFKPQVISMEINENIPPPVFFSVLYDKDHYWPGDHFFGCSAVAASETVKPYGYILESIQYNNAIFVSEDVSLGKIQDQSVTEAYFNGYLNKADRRNLFPWNKDVENVHELSADKKVLFFERLFDKYKGKFVIHA